MSFLSDIAALAKAGYSAQDVKDLMQLSKPAENLQTDAQPTPTETGRTVLQTESPEPEKSQATTPKESEQSNDVTDYKALYEAEQEKVRDLQNKNNNIDVSGQNNITVTEDHLIDLVKSFC